MSANQKFQSSHVEAVTHILAALRSQFDQASSALASQCSAGGKLDAKALDDHQLVSFELAWASADLLAAEAALKGLEQNGDELAQRLALTYAVEAVLSVAAKLEGIFIELELDTATLQKITIGVELKTLRHDILSGAALAETAKIVAAANTEIGQIELSEHLALVQGEFRRFGENVVAPLAERIHRHDLTIPEELLQPLREMGVFGLSIPEQYGGTAPDDRDDNLTMIVVTEALSEASLGGAGSLITRPEILSRALITGGTEAQKAHWLPKIAAGNPLCAIAITEPDYGSDVASLSLKGTRTEGGWLLNGAKTWCTFAGKAGLMMVVTRTDPDRSLGYRGLSILLVEKPSYDGHEFVYKQEENGARSTGKPVGKLIGKAIPTIGYRGMHSFDVSFENFFVPDANVIGGEAGLGKGFYFTMAGMMGGRMQTAARASGVMRAALRAALQYAADRKVFGAPLFDYQLTQVKLAKMAARFAACRQLTYSVGRLLDSGGGRMEASLVKLFACRSAEMLTREALQIYGGMGYAEETAVSRYFVDARVLSIFEGAEETLALKVIARTILENALENSATKKSAEAA